MAKPTYTIGNLDWETTVRINAFLGGVPTGAVVGVAAPAAPAPPPAPAAPAPPAPAAPPPVAAPAPPPPPAPAPAPAPAGSITIEQLIAKMGEVVSQPGKAASVSGLMARYNSKAPGTPGPVGNVDPVQYQNLYNELCTQ